MSASIAVAPLKIKEGIVYATVGDRELLCDVYEPERESEGSEIRPAVLVVHPGAWRSGNRK